MSALDTSYNVANYTEQGGAVSHIGGTLQVEANASVVPSTGTRAAAIADASGGATVDAEARTAINAVLAALRNLKMIDP